MTNFNESIYLQDKPDKEQQLLQRLAAGETRAFWPLFQQHRDYLFRCCVKWIGGNPTDAEDALSRAMLKALEKVQKYAGEITNFKAWLTTLTHNLCVDIHRERSRGANIVEDIEVYARSEEQGLVSFENMPESAVETGEKRMVIRRAIDNLVTRLRETFILHFYQEFSYQEIAQQQNISYQNVCKRISQARKILQEVLRGYFIGEEGTDTDKSVPPTATESAIGEMSEGNGGVEAGAGETVLSVAVEEVESVGGEESPEVGLSVLPEEPDRVAATSEGKVYSARNVESLYKTLHIELDHTYKGKICQHFIYSARSQTELFPSAVLMSLPVNDVHKKARSMTVCSIEGKRDGCRWVDLAIGERQPGKHLTFVKRPLGVRASRLIASFLARTTKLRCSRLPVPILARAQCEGIKKLLTK